jgi:Putative prokaryotic signal transducing protein
MQDKRIAGGLGLLAAAIAVGVINSRVFPHGSYYIIALVLLWASWTLIARGWRSRSEKGEALRERVRPLKPGESYDRPVKLAMVPNAPTAELWRQRLHREGIEAFYKGSLLRNPSIPVTLWVGEHDFDRARELFPELQ